MQSKEERDKESQERLQGLALIMREVYMPSLESKKDTQQSINRFTNNIQTAVQQAYGTVTIYVPQIDMEEEEEITRNRELIDQLQSAVVSKKLQVEQCNGSKHHSRVPELLQTDICSLNSSISRSSFLFEIQI